MGRVMGLDLGARRVGVALSDSGRALATPYEVIDRVGADLAARLREIVADEQVEAVVVGLPVSLSGQEGPAASAARDQAARLEEELAVPVEMFDERLTTVAAQRPLMELDMKGAARRRVIDKVAAAVMLQSWLDGHHG